jgi:Ca2+-binding RTX toxin-like protein
MPITGDNGNNNLSGTSGDDLILGLGGQDTLSGLGGNDTLRGGAGDDTIDGGSGLDLIDFSDGMSGISFTLHQGVNPAVGSGGFWSSGALAGGLGTDSYKNIEGVIGTNFNDTLIGSIGNDTLLGLGGNDTLSGDDGNDILDGGDGNDTLQGQKGDDILIGGKGADLLTGGNGKDTFIYKTDTSGTVVDYPYSVGNYIASPYAVSARSTWDIITDFTSGQDRIDFSQLNLFLTGPGPDQLFYASTSTTDAGAGTTAASRAHAVWSNNGRFLYADINGDGAADMKLQVSGITSIIGVFSDSSPDAPAVAVNIVDATLNHTAPSSLVTFQFNKTVTGFDVGDLTPVGGTLSAFTMVNPHSYTAIFTATDGLATTGSVTVGAGSYTDLALNPGEAGADTVAIDTVRSIRCGRRWPSWWRTRRSTLARRRR